VRSTLTALGTLLAGALALAGEAAAPQPVGFAAKPSAAKDGDKVKIAFAASAPTDAEVAVLDAGGKVVRHLAAGMLGKNAPEPLKPDSLAQELVWDGRDDAGKPAAGGPFSARVRLGSNPRVEKLFSHEPGAIHGSIQSVTASPTGELYVLVSEIHKFGHVDLLVLDRDGKYLRTIMPYSAATPRERTESVGHLIIDGQREPIVYSAHAGCVYPLTCGLRSQTMAWHPKGYLIAVSSLGTAREHGPARYLIAFDPNGGAPAGVPFVGPQLLAPRGFLGGGGERYCRGLDRVATSPDGQYVYVVHDFEGSGFMAKVLKHGVYRVKWDDKSADEPWIGKAEPGSDDEHFKNPQGLAVDAEGRLFVCDRGNDRVKVYSAEGKLLGKFAVDSPEQIALEAKSGRIIVLSRAADAKAAKATLVAFGPFKDGGAKKLFEMSPSAVRAMTLDQSGPAPRVWLSVAMGWGKPDDLVRVNLAADRFEPEAVALPRGMQLPSFIAADPARNRIIVKEHLQPATARPFSTFDLTSGKRDTLPVKGADIALDRDGNIYVMGAGGIHRYDPAGKALPFAGGDSNKIALKYRSYGPDEGLRGHCVAPDGDIYVIRSVDHGLGASLDLFGPDGKLKKAGLVAGLGSGDGGLGVDARGNVYVGVNIKDPGKPYADPFNDLVPKTAWTWWKSKREAPWRYLYCNVYLCHMGSLFKFGPEGGTIYGAQTPHLGTPIISPGTELEKAPAGAQAFKSSCMKRDIKVEGAKWHFPGIGAIPASMLVDGPSGDPGCSCMPSHLTADLYGRTYAPNIFRHSVDMIDPAGNLVRRIGRYGNVDDASPAAKDQACFCMPVACAWADGRLFVSDGGNHQVVGLRFDYAAEESVDVK
jgi:hypothetical protein